MASLPTPSKESAVKPPPPVAWRDVALILAVGGLFGATFVLIKVALTSITPFTIGLLRLALAAVPLLLVLRLPPPSRIWVSFTVMGVGNGALAYVLINWSAQHIEAGLVGILIATTPIFAAVLAHLFTLDERLRAGTVLAVAVGFVGVLLLLGPGALLRLEAAGMRVWGVLAMLGAALCYAVAAVHGTDDAPVDLARRNAQAIGAGHSFLIVLGNAFPINVLPAVRRVPEVCRIYCATSNPLQVIVAESDQGRGIVGLIDGQPPLGIEDGAAIQERRSLLRTLGYKL